MVRNEPMKHIKEKYPKCIYANWKFCWQRVGNSIWVYKYGVPDESKCAACLAAHINWGEGATRRPMTKEEIKKEKEENNKEANKNGSINN